MNDSLAAQQVFENRVKKCQGDGYMTVILVILTGLCGWLLAGRIRSIYEVRSLCRQLEEVQRGSHMELGVQGRQSHMLALCRKINELLRQQHQTQLQYEKTQRQLKQNITSLAHDIRTPLTGASGYVQLAQECGGDARRKRYLQTALGRIQELGDMLEELFLYTKLTSEEFEPSMQELQVLPLLSECLVGMYHQFEKKGVSPEVELESEGFRVWADEECLRRIFHNLIQNALLHGMGGIVIRQTGNQLIFENTVAETSRPDPERIFERFYKADSAQRKGSSGLGMFIVKELAKKMGGWVEAELQGDVLVIKLGLKECIR